MPKPKPSAEETFIEAPAVPVPDATGVAAEPAPLPPPAEAQTRPILPGVRKITLHQARVLHRRA